MKHLYAFCLCFLFTTLAAQPGKTIALEYEDADGNLIVSTMAYSHIHSDRNVYTDGTMYVYWTGLQWTIGTSDYKPYFVTDVNTTPNPPDLASGNWEVVDSDTKLIVFGGTGTVDDGDPVKINLTVDANIQCNGESTGQLTATVTKGVAKFNYEWSNGSNTPRSGNSVNTISGLTAGTYGITVTDANGNEAVGSVTLAEPDELRANAKVERHVSCQGSFNGAVTAAPTGGTGPYTYSWSAGVSTASVSGLEGGKYTLTVTDANGCESIEEVTVNEPEKLTVAVKQQSNVSCNGGNGGSVELQASGGTEPYRYDWSNNETGNSLTELKAGTYTVTVTDGNGCTATLDTKIEEPDALTTTATVIGHVLCHGSADGSGRVTAIGGTEPYRYAWSDGSTEATITGLSGGTYPVTVTDGNGCTSVSSMTVNEADALEPVLAVTDASCRGAGSAELSVAGGTGPYVFSWSTGAATSAIGELTGGNYSVTVTDANECEWIKAFEVKAPAELDLTLSSTMDSGNGDGTAAVAVTGGLPPYTYVWSTDPVSSTAELSGLRTGIYTVQVTDASGCSQRAMVKVAMGIRGDACTTAIEVDSLLGGATDEQRLLASINSADYRKATPLPESLTDCFTGEDSLHHPVWFTFTGDGGTYRLSVSDCEGDDCLTEDKLLAAIFEGSCGDGALIDCSAGVPAGRSRAGLEITTRAGESYSVVMDGKGKATGRFRLEMTALASTGVTRLPATVISVFPNPTTGRVAFGELRPRRVEVFSHLGTRLLRIDEPGTAVDLAALPAGVYTLRLTGRENDAYTARVIRQ